MSKSNSRTFNTLSFCWEPGIRMQFIFVEENDFPFLNVRAETNQASDGKSPHSTETEGTSQAQASYNARLCDACEVICAPSVSCLIVADNFINGGFSKTVEGYYLYKQFRSLVVGHGYNVDETYESSLQSPENSKIDPYINLVWRVNMTFLSLQNKYSSSEYKMVIVFVDKCLESVLKNAYFMPLAPLEPRISPVGDPSLDAEKKEE
ncbi:conserved hypothetical protein [Trichinella spiralis]|uniref:hypothetical protein n=1 Tax=Trichinella spiralis TaxID=6334 RepID=UPI0001EFE8A0|nr:conserved hypothetical protein [Trichinella spiralis]